MKTQLKYLALIMLCIAFTFASCNEKENDNSTLLLLLLGGGTTFENAVNPGDKVTVTAGSIIFKMIYANNQDSITFPILINEDPLSTGTLTCRFFMAETEVTNALFATVLQWAYNNGKISESGTVNLVSAATVKYGNRELIDLDNDTTYMKISYNPSTDTFSVAPGYENHPVVLVSWYGAVMFCNWLTEMMDGNTNNLVYSGMDDSWDDEETAEAVLKKGYRLPSIDEWEYSARYRGADSVNTVSGYIDPYYTKGNSASGATTYYNDATGGPNYAGKLANDLVAVYGYYWDGDSWEQTGVTRADIVKGSRIANTLGLYDMSGNVSEWCFTQSGSNRIRRGGDWSSGADEMQVGQRIMIDPDPFFITNYIGFRIARTK